MKFEPLPIMHGIPLLEIGNTIQISGVLFSGADKHYLIPFPEEHNNEIEWTDCKILKPTLEEWKTLLRQTDLLETEVLANDNHGLIKAILRKSQRQIDQKVAWNVYRRDGYKCRYCGRDTVPLTVDHLVLWEVGGPSIEENLLSSCKNCNKARGNMEYSDWLKSEFYLNVSKGLDDEVIMNNQLLVETLKDIPVRVHKMSRGSKKKKRR